MSHLDAAGPARGLTTVRALARHAVAALCAATLAPAWAVALNDVRPDAIKGFVQADRVTVVLFTSRDPKCIYCQGQDHVFNVAAVGYANEPPVFAIVRWQPWPAFPQMGLPRPIRGIPHVKVFRKGEVLAEIDGKFTDPARLKTVVDDALAGRLQPMPADPASLPASAASAASPTSGSAAASAQTLDAAQQADVSLLLRRQLLTEASKGCVRRFPVQAAASDEALGAWQARHGEAAARGQLVLVGVADVRATIEPLGQQQRRQLEQQLPLPPSPAAGDCERVHRFVEQDTAAPAPR